MSSKKTKERHTLFVEHAFSNNAQTLSNNLFCQLRKPCFYAYPLTCQTLCQDLAQKNIIIVNKKLDYTTHISNNKEAQHFGPIVFLYIFCHVMREMFVIHVTRESLINLKPLFPSKRRNLDNSIT